MASKKSFTESSLSSQSSPQKSKSVPPSPFSSKELVKAVHQYGIHCASSKDLETQLKNRLSLSSDQVNKLTNDQTYHDVSAKLLSERFEKVRKTLFPEDSPQKGSPHKDSPQKGSPQD